ncbi:hypothetical protein ACSBR2_025392 [Camellia fascicularis]
MHQFMIGSDAKLSTSSSSMGRKCFHLKIVTELLVIEVTKEAKGPLVLVVMSGGLVDLSFANSTRLEGSCDRSPFSWYPQSYVDQVPMTDMNLWEDSTINYPNRTYQFYSGKLMYNFGHGLSYSVFSKFIMFACSTMLVRPRDNTNMIVSFNSFDISALECHNLYLDMAIGLRNDGPNDGTHVVLVFWEPSNAHELLTRTPKKQLVAFERIQVNIEETEKMTVNLDICKQLNIVDWIGLDWIGIRWLILRQHPLFVGCSREPQAMHQFMIGSDAKLSTSSSSMGRKCFHQKIITDPMQCYSVMISVYARIPCKYTSLLQGLEKFVSKVSYEPECSDMACSNNSQLRATTEVAVAANAVIVVVGLSQSFETEMLDRFNPTSLGYQELLVFEVAKVARGPLVLVVMSGGRVDLSFANNTKVGGILGVSYPGQAGGNAIAQIIFEKFNPANGQGMLTRTPKKQLVASERIQVNIEEIEKMTVKLDICKQLSIVDWIGLDWD